MSVPEQMPIVEYTANGTTTRFPITFDLHDVGYLNVFINKELAPIGSYTVDNFEAVVFATAPNENDEVTLIRDTQLDRETNYQSFDNSFRPAAVNYDFDKIWHVLQEQNLIDGKLLARLKEEIEWRRTHDFNYDELAQVREKQLFDALKGYTDTLVAAVNPGIFQGVIAGVVFARDGKSVQTHIEEILAQLEIHRTDVLTEKNRAMAAEFNLDTKIIETAENLSKSISSEVERAKTAELNLQLQISTTTSGIKYFSTVAELNAFVPKETDPKQAYVFETKKNYLWDTASAAWKDEGLSQFDVAKNYFDSQIQIDHKNLYDPSKIVSGRYVLTSDGSIQENTESQIAYFSVQNGKTYAVRSQNIEKYGFAISLRDSSSTAVGATLGLVTLNNTSDPSVKTFTVSNSVAKFAFINILIPTQSFDIRNDLTINEGMSVDDASISVISGVNVKDSFARANMLLSSELLTTENLYSASNNHLKKFVRSTTGNIETSAADTVMNVFPVFAGITYAVTCDDFSTSAFVIALRETNSVMDGATLGLVTLKDTANPAVKTFIVPENSTAKFAFMNIKLPSISYDISNSISLNIGNYIADEEVVVGINSKEIADLKARENMLSAQVISNLSIYDLTTMLKDGFYISVSNNTLQANTAGKVAVIPVVAGKQYHITFAPQSANIQRFRFMSTSSLSANKETLAPSFSETISPNELKLTAPEGANYLVATAYLINTSYNFDISESLVVKDVSNLSPTNSEIVTLNGLSIVDLQARKQLQDFEISSTINTLHRFKDQKFYTFGDSVTQGTRGGYVQYLQKTLGCKLTNYGNSGSKADRMVGIITDQPNRDPATQNSNFPEIDYSNVAGVSIMIGTNDAATWNTQEPIGSIADIPVGRADTAVDLNAYWQSFPNTFYGNLAMCIEFIMYKNKDIEIILVTSPMNNQHSENMKSIRLNQLEIAKYYGLKIIDAQIECGINSKNVPIFTYDNLHFNEEGNRRFGNYLARTIASA